MNGKINTPRTVCKAIVAVAIAAIAVAAIIGCSSLGGGSRRQSIATVIQTAYDMGGREIHLRRDAPGARRSGWVSEVNCETYPPTEGRCRRQSLEWCRKAPRR